MKIILLSGGSGKRLWPLSNDTRSKQFLKVLSTPDGKRESMIQRVVRQIREVGLSDDIVAATAANQKDAIENQLGQDLTVVTEPERRDTFPAILLACSYLADNGTSPDEPIVVMPCDSYTENSYFSTIKLMTAALERDEAKLILMGVRPTYPSAKYGYIIPAEKPADGVMTRVRKFIEKPDVDTANSLLSENGLWNGGVFAFKLGYLLDYVSQSIPDLSYRHLISRYCDLPALSFDYAVAEKVPDAAVIPYGGEWKDLGTWNTLTDELRDFCHGNTLIEECDNTYIINELEMPIVCIGAEDMVVAASPDGILVSKRKLSENIKHIVDTLSRRPMYEERRWGEYKVIDSVEFDDGFCALTKQLTLRPGCSISYQRHNCRDEVWTFISGEGEIVLDGVRRPVGRGDVVTIDKGTLHTLRATTPLTFIEVQRGSNLIEEDIERFPYRW